MNSVYTNVQSNSIYNTYSINNRQGNNFMQRLASGLKVMTPKDNASVYAISERMRSQIRANEQANQNAQNDAALLKTAQGGISNTVDILKTLKERAINAANDSNLNQNRSDIATEVQQLGLQIDDNAYKVKYNNRAVLNGGFDTTVGRLNGSSATAAKASASLTDNPTTNATHAVYNITGLKSFATGSSADAGNTSLLVDLGKVGAENKYQTAFNSGDKITFSWKENGTTVSKEITIDNTTKIDDLVNKLNSSNLMFSFQGNDATKLTSNDDTTTNATANKVLNASNFEELTVKDAGGTGLYAIGNKDVRITDFSVSVTSKALDGSDITNVEAQKLLTFNGVQQSFGPTKEGSNAVFSSKLYVADTSKGIDATDGNATQLKNLKTVGGTTIYSDATEFGIKIDSNTEFKISAESTIDDLNNELKTRGYDIRAYLLNAGDEITYEGTTVTRGSGENQTALKATASALYFVAGDGKDISSIEISPYKAAEASATAATADTSGLATNEITSLQSRKTSEDSVTSSSNPLTFFIGGEPNFGIEVTINKMDIKSLMGVDVDSFAKKFLTKEGAESALTMIDDAISKALNEQTKLGAIESRLGYASDNLTTMNTNMEETDSVLRDSDIAKDMVQFSKYSVLSQFAQAMLAQANNSGAGMLQFLQP